MCLTSPDQCSRDVNIYIIHQVLWCSSPAKSGSDEGRVAKHCSRAQESAQAELGGQGWGGAIVWRWGQARESRGRRCSSRPGGLQGRVVMGGKGASVQVVAKRVARRQGAWEGHARRVGLHPGLLTFPPLGPAVLEPDLEGHTERIRLINRSSVL